jgi:Putative transposase
MQARQGASIKKMADTAAHLVDRVIPRVAVRQWVLSLPFALRYRVAFDGALLGKVLGIFVRAVFGSLKRRAREYGISGGQCGAVTFIQRFGSALNLTPHFHALVFDGVYAAEEGEVPRFYPLRPPDKSDVLAVAARVAERAAGLMEPPESGGDGIEEPEFGALYNASIMGRIATGPNAGRRVKTWGRLRTAEHSPLVKKAESWTEKGQRSFCQTRIRVPGWICCAWREMCYTSRRPLS